MVRGVTDVPEPLTVTLDAVQAGWGTLVLRAGCQCVEIRCSHVEDCFGDLIRGLAGLLGESGKFEIKPTSENRGGHLVSFRRVKQDLEIVVKRLLHDWNPTEREKGRQTRARFRWRGPFRGGVEAVMLAFRALLDSLRPSGYASAWGHALPSTEFALLEKFLE